MTKDEIKNRISLALKDPILQQGFECICKKNAELKKACDETQELLDKQIEATYKLDKENAELKRIVRMVAMINKNIYTEEGIKAIYEEAEQFLSEVEK